jgi:hypothetical protein
LEDRRANRDFPQSDHSHRQSNPKANRRDLAQSLHLKENLHRFVERDHPVQRGNQVRLLSDF